MSLSFGGIRAGDIGSGPGEATLRSMAIAAMRREGGGPNLVTDSKTGVPVRGGAADAANRRRLANAGITAAQVANHGGLDNFLTTRFGSNYYSRAIDALGRSRNPQGVRGGAGGAAGLGGVGADLGSIQGQLGIDPVSRSILGFGGYDVGPLTIGLGNLLSHFLGPVGALMGGYRAVQGFGPFNAVHDYSGPQGLYGKPQVGTPGFGLSTGRYGPTSRPDPGGRPNF